jgi:hypothetical protein
MDLPRKGTKKRKKTRMGDVPSERLYETLSASNPTRILGASYATLNFAELCIHHQLSHS